MNQDVVHLSSAHGANDIRIFHKECRSLAAAGYNVTLIARSDHDDIVDRVKVRALKTRSDNRFVRMTKSVFRVYRMAIEMDSGLYHLHDPELIPAGILLKARRKRVFFDAHEDVYRQILDKQWIPVALRRPVGIAYRLLERIASRMFDGFIAATPSIAQNFPKHKTTVVQNFPMRAELEMLEGQPYHDRPCNVAYVGGLSEKRGAREILDALVATNHRTNARLLFAGSITPKQLADEVRQSDGWKYVDHRGWQDRRGVAAMLDEARLGIVVFHPAANHVESQPNKLFEYMLAGLPVIASNFQHWNQFVSDVDSGLQVDPLDPTAIAEAIIWLLQNPGEAEAMGKRGREAVLAKYTWEKEVVNLLQAYDGVLRRSGA